MTAPLVYIIMVNWNLKEVTLDCLESLHELTYPNFRIVVVDNHSEDESPRAISERFPDVEQILNNKNLGSTAAYNVGFRRALEANAQFAMLINNDTIIDPNALNLIVEACLPEDVGLAGPLIFYYDAPDKIWSAGSMLSRLTLDLTDDNGRDKIFTGITERDFLTCCALLFKREVLEKVGLMDEDYFFYQEELDYCYQVREAGYRILLVPEAKVWHKVSLTAGGSGSPVERYWMAKNSVLYYRKHAAWWNWFFIIPWRTGSAVKNTFRLAYYGKWKALRTYWVGLRDGIRFPL